MPLALGPPTREVVALELPPPSRPRVLHAITIDDSSNGDDVEDEGRVLEVTSTLKVTPVLSLRVKKKIDVMSRTWVPEST